MPEAGVVHHGRKRVHDGIADDAVHRGPRSQVVKAELVEHALRRHLAGGDVVAGIGPAVADPGREHARRQAVVTHRNQHVSRTAVAFPGLAERHDLRGFGERPCLHGELGDFGARTRERLPTLGEIRRAFPVDVRRHDHAAAAAPGNQLASEFRLRLDVDELGAPGNRLFENAPPLLLGPLEEPVLPGGPAGDDHGMAPAFERAGHVRPVDGVEAHLDDVGAGYGVAILSDFAHRAAGDGHTQL